MIVISPYSKKTPSGKKCAKDYPFWEELIGLLPGDIVQIGLPGEEKLVPDFRTYSLPELREFIKEMDFYISVDNFFPHFCHHYGRHGIVLWGTSDPKIFGYPENMNLLKDRKYLRKDQFLWWDNDQCNPDAFVKPEKVIGIIKDILEGIKSS